VSRHLFLSPYPQRRKDFLQQFGISRPQGVRHKSMSLYYCRYRSGQWDDHGPLVRLTLLPRIGRVSLLFGWIAAIGGEYVCLGYTLLVYMLFSCACFSSPANLRWSESESERAGS
jgi:hypothetical protein